MVEWIIMQIHHARQSGGESKSVLDAAVSVQPHQSVPLRDIMQKTDFQKANHQESVERVAVNLKKGIEPPQKKKCYLFLSLAKKVSGLWWMAQNGRKEMRDYLRAHTKSLGLEKKILTPKSCY